jgi:SpoVK/Ycf46/Vps4 family AAA+-type ATPase
MPLPDLPARRKMLDLYLSKRPVTQGIDFDTLAKRMEGYSGADIKYICDRAATIPFLRSVATGQEGEIDQQILDDVIQTAPKSVTPDLIKRFDVWAQQATSG